jgi:hypothetical protein
MVTNISYNVIIDRLKAFAVGHYLIKHFSHGQIDLRYLEQGADYYPWMHVIPGTINPAEGLREYSFDITFSDLTRDKEHESEYIREAISDCTRLAEDLLAEIKNGNTLFDSSVQIVDGSSITPFIHEDTHTLTGVTLSLSIRVPWDWSACDIPADYAPGGSSSGGSGSGGCCVTLQVGGIDNIDQSLLNLIAGTNMTITDNGDGSVTFDSTGGGGGGLLLALPFTTDHISATGNEYLIGDVVYYSGNVYRCIANNDSILPTDANYWLNLGAGYPLIQQPADWNSSSGNNQILNKPTIPSDLDDLADVNAPSPSNGQVLTYNSTSGDWEAATPSTSSGTVTSVALTVPSAFNVTGSPITTSGTLAISGAGLATQYVRGDGQLANFPTTSGGGSSVSYYLNGSINQGTIGGSTYYQMSKTAVFGPGTDFTRTNVQGDGLIAQFITDANDPNVLLIPGGNFNLEFYFSASSGGGSPSFYVELYKYDGSTSTFTLLATDVATPEGITQGTVIDAYFTALAVPPTVMTLTDRLAVRVFVTTSGRTLVLHTENSHLCQVITTLSTGINAINGLTSQVQNLATGTAGSDFAINSTGSTHTFNLPTASAANRGALSSADWSTFNGKQNSVGFTTVGNNIATLANPSAITYLKIAADNTVSAITAAQLKTDLGIPSGSMFRLIKTADQSITASNTTAVDITDLTFPITSGKKYRIRAFLIHSGNPSAGLKFGVNANVAVTSVYQYNVFVTGTTNNAISILSGNTLGVLPFTAGVSTSLLMSNIECIIDANNTGTAAIQFAKSVATGGTLTIKAGSIVEYYEY